MDLQVRRRTLRADNIRITAIQNEFNNISLHHIIAKDNRGDHLGGNHVNQFDHITDVTIYYNTNLDQWSYITE